METVIQRRTVKETQTDYGDLHPLIARLYRARGVHSTTELSRELKSLLPYQDLMNIDKAVACLTDAIRHQHRIVVVGDYDVDGATSTALAVSALRRFGAQHVDYIVPNRFEYGYGLSPELVEVVAKRDPQLIITVDNGIASISGVEAANAAGIKVLITDHHLAGDSLPDAEAIVNPNLPGDSFPSKNLAGVGVIFYLMMAFRAYLRSIDWFEERDIQEPNLAELLDLVALGTVADVVPLDQNNRILVHHGLQRMRQGQIRPGIQALLDVAGRDPAQLVASDLGFAVGPRLNAAGRLDDMSIGIACLLAEDMPSARLLAKQLDTLNRDRREIESDMRLQAISVVEQLHFDSVIPVGLCLFQENWHQGVIGIVASRIKDRLHRPVIVFAADGEKGLKGSARSIQGVHIRDVLDAIATRHPELITKFGGHAMAAGLSLPRNKFDEFKAAFDQEVRQHVSESDLRGQILSDGELSKDELCLDIAEIVRNAGPWGQGFAEPIFDGIFHIVEQRLLQEKHLKLLLTLDQKHFFDAIAFNVDNKLWPNHRCEKVKIAYKLDINSWQGRRSLQLIVEHVVAMV